MQKIFKIYKNCNKSKLKSIQKIIESFLMSIGRLSDQHFCIKESNFLCLIILGRFKIFYYDFCREDEKNMIVEKIKQEAGKYRKKIKILKIKTAGEIGAYRIRIRVDFAVL